MAPHHHSCFLSDQNLTSIFENSHPRNISLTLFSKSDKWVQRKEFFRISSYSYSATSPPPPPPPTTRATFLDGSILLEQFLKRVKGIFL